MPARETFRFGDFELDVAAYELRRDGRRVRLERQPLDLLILLVARRGEMVSRAEIAAQLWGDDVFVEVDTSIHTAVRKIRQALGDTPDASIYVETVPGRGYRFVAAVEVRAANFVASDLAPIEPVIPTSAEGQPSQATSPIAVAESAKVFPRRYAWIALATVATAAAAFFAWRVYSPAATTVTLVVLPFENLSSVPDREYLATGLLEETIVSLGQVDPDRLKVVSRTSSMAYQGVGKSAAEIGRALGADYLLESSIRAEANRLRVTSTLIRVSDEIQIWSQAYDREPTSVLALQQELSVAIARQILARLSPNRLDMLAQRQTRDPDAYDLYLRGRNFMIQRNPATTRRALEYFARATALDPDYALAWSGMAVALSASILNGDGRPADVWPGARDAVARAIRAQPTLPEALQAQAYVNWILEWNWPAAEIGFRESVARDPRMAFAHLTLGHLMSQTGRHLEARRSAQRARELDPLDLTTHAVSSQMAFQARDYQAALGHAEQATALDPEF